MKKKKKTIEKFINLNDIKYHPMLTRHSDSLSILSYRDSALGQIYDKYLEQSLISHPIVTVKIGADNYSVSGLRTLQLAKAYYILQKYDLNKIQVRHLELCPQNDTETLGFICNEIFIDHLFRNLARPRQVYDIYRSIIDDPIMKQILQSQISIKGKVHLAEMLGISYNTMCSDEE